MLFLPEGQDMEKEKNRLETQRKRMQIDFMFTKSTTLQKHYRSTTINKARSVGADEDDFVS